jgi:CHAP domain
MKFPILLGLLLFSSCAPQVTPAATEFHPQSGNPAPRIAAYCKAQSGRKVGNGECWTLADEAFKSAGTKRPGRDMRVWGRIVNPSKEAVKPGDIVEFRSARFSDGIITGQAHTAVVIEGGTEGKFTIAEQNWGKKTVRFREMSATNLIAGEMVIYRPE